MDSNSAYRGDLAELDAVIDEYTDWFLQFVRIVFFTVEGSSGHGARMDAPTSFVQWAKQATHNNQLDTIAVGGLLLLHKELSSTAQTVQALPRGRGNLLENENCEKLTLLFEEFLNKLKRTSRQDVNAKKDINSVTGLHAQNSFYKDVHREMERLARQGKTFSLAIIKIDDYKRIEAEASPADVESIMKSVALAIGKVVRSYDDYYHFDKNIFVALLRQTDPGGGLRALQRLNEELKGRNVLAKLKAGTIHVTTSSCIAEVTTGDNMRQLIENLRKEVESEHNRPATVAEYQETSELQKLLREGKG